MKKLSVLLFAAALCGVLLSACAQDDSDAEGGNSVSTTETAAAVSAHMEELTICSGEKEIYGRLFFPGMSTAEKRPVVIFSHGYNGSHADFIAECRYFIDQGFLAFTYDFCGGSTRSRSSGKSTDMTIFTEKEDLLAVIDYLSTLDQVDSENIFLLGGSQGGLVTALAAEERPQQVKAMVLYFPAFNIPDDWRRNYPSEAQIPETVDFWGLMLGKEFFTSMRRFHVYDHIGSFSGPVLILYGDKDAIVPLSACKKAAEEYAQAELVILPGEGHGFSPAGAKTAMEKAFAFMKEQYHP